VFRVDSHESLVVIEVRRSGSLARLGHDHIVASREVVGYVAPDEGRADCTSRSRACGGRAGAARRGRFRHPAERVRHRRNALQHAGKGSGSGEVSVRAHPGERSERERGEVTLHVAITLHGSTRTLQAPAEIDATRKNERDRRFSFDQTDFGITPYSLLGGAIAVKNRVELRFRIMSMSSL